MGHHAEHVPALVDDARDVVQRAVRVGARDDASLGVAVAKRDLAALLEPRKRRGIGEVAALAVRDRDTDDVALGAPAGERKVGAFDEKIRPLAPKLQRGVADQRARQEAGLAQDLKPVADAPHEAAAVGELADPLHHGRETRDRAGPQVVAVGEAAGEDDAVTALELGVLVPQVDELLAEDLVDDPAAVAIRPRSREHHDPELHLGAFSLSSSKRKSSMTWLASSCRHIASTCWRACGSLVVSSRTSMYLPTRTSLTSRKPSEARPCLTVRPWGSLTTGFGVTMTRAITVRSSASVGTTACRPASGTRSGTAGASA